MPKHARKMAARHQMMERDTPAEPQPERAAGDMTAEAINVLTQINDVLSSMARALPDAAAELDQAAAAVSNAIQKLQTGGATQTAPQLTGKSEEVPTSPAQLPNV